MLLFWKSFDFFCSIKMSMCNINLYGLLGILMTILMIWINNRMVSIFTLRLSLGKNKKKCCVVLQVEFLNICVDRKNTFFFNLFFSKYSKIQNVGAFSTFFLKKGEKNTLSDNNFVRLQPWCFYFNFGDESVAEGSTTFFFLALFWFLNIVIRFKKNRWGHFSVHSDEVPISFSLAIRPDYSTYNVAARGSPVLPTSLTFLA